MGAAAGPPAGGAIDRTTGVAQQPEIDAVTVSVPLRPHLAYVCFRAFEQQSNLAGYLRRATDALRK